VYTAVLYTLLTPVYGSDTIRAFQSKNAAWVSQYVMPYESPRVTHQYNVHVNMVVGGLKRLFESILLEPIGDSLEKVAERIQRALITRHRQGRAGRVSLSRVELAFHPDTKVPTLLAAYAQDPDQKPLL
jgi:hypothetical protein